MLAIFPTFSSKTISKSHYETGLKATCDTVNSDESFVQKCRSSYAKMCKRGRANQPTSSDDDEDEHSDEEAALQAMNAELREQLDAAKMENDTKQGQIGTLEAKVERLEEVIQSLRAANGECAALSAGIVNFCIIFFRL